MTDRKMFAIPCGHDVTDLYVIASLSCLSVFLQGLRGDLSLPTSRDRFAALAMTRGRGNPHPPLIPHASSRLGSSTVLTCPDLSRVPQRGRQRASTLSLRDAPSPPLIPHFPFTPFTLRFTTGTGRGSSTTPFNSPS